MSQTTVSIRMDDDLKSSMEGVCRELGMNMTTAFTIFARKVCREQRIPFDVSIDSRFNAESIAAFQEAEDIIAGRKRVKGYRSAQEMIDAILAEEDDDADA